ncbi:MAG: hypothetical protein Q9183_002650 [Haloplaca sp. 2 TL-2023]
MKTTHFLTATFNTRITAPLTVVDFGSPPPQPHRPIVLTQPGVYVPRHQDTSQIGIITNDRRRSLYLKIPSAAPKIWRALKKAPRRIPSWGLHPLADGAKVEMSAPSLSMQEQGIIVFRMRRFTFKPVRSKYTAPRDSPLSRHSK